MWEVVRTLVRDGSTVLLTTQYLEEADQLADEISVIDHGRVIAHDTPLGLKRQAGSRTLSVTPTDPADGPAVAQLLAGFSPEEPTPLPGGGSSVPVLDERALPATVAGLAERGIAVSELSLHLPTLAEVFSTLTQNTHPEEVAA
jgi:oleandomycin transport system ATP-binding protein